MKLTNEQYDRWKWIAQIFLPALGTFIYAVNNVIAIPYAKEVVGILTALDAFLGALLQISTERYYNSLDDENGVG